MNLEIIRKLRLANPFRPFYVLLADGRRLFVEKPYHVGVSVDLSHMMVCSDGPDAHHLFPDDVADVDVLPPSVKTSA
ncbi:MAG TPA: hypothetical protein VEA69_23385 [Tepidisphaeraceae bacterium]|nr:hypothetical protein [Tepidisphaeraceae bacterium]